MRWLLSSFSLFATTVAAETETVTALEPISSPYLLKLTGGLILVVIVIVLLGWIVKKLNLNQQSHNGLIRIIAGLSIGTRDRIVLLQIGDEQILIGLTPGRIEKLHTLSQPLQAPEAPLAPTSFAAKLNRLMRDREVT